MKLNRKLNRILFVLALFTIWIAPAYGANKDIIELQTQVSQLQQQMTQMKQSFDERMGVMRNLLEKNTDAANKVSAIVRVGSVMHIEVIAECVESPDILDKLRGLGVGYAQGFGIALPRPVERPPSAG